MNAMTETKLPASDTAAPGANIYTALCAAQANMGRVVKGATNPAFKSRYADLADVVAVVVPALSAEGVALFHSMGRDTDGLYMRTTLAHGASGTTIHCDVPLIVDRQNMQGMKSAVTYAKRIGVESLTGIAPEDDDGNAAAAAAPRQDTRPAPRAPAHRPDPSHDRPSPADHAIGALGAAETLDALAAIWRDLPTSVRALPEVIGAKDNRKAALAAPVADPVTDDEIPY
jgi:hypothetical protein